MAYNNMTMNMRFKIAIWIAFTALHTASCHEEEIAAPTDTVCTIVYTSHPLHGQYMELLQAYQRQTLAPGSIAGVKQVGQPAWVGATGYGNLAHQSPMDVCTPFRTGSVTKMFTATLVLALTETGELGLDDKITAHLPALRSQVPQADEITIRQLLNHTSGLGHPTDDDLEYQLGLINNAGYFARLSPRERLHRFIYDQPLKHTPGATTYYSNAGYWLLEWVVETATGKSFAECLQERILTPLGLRETYLTKRENSRVARGYNSSGNYLQDVTQWDSADSDGDPAAGIISTAADLLTFGEALFGGVLLSQQSLEAMTAIFADPHCHDCGYGLGIEPWTVGPFIGYGMNGSSLGVDANLIYFPEQRTTVVLFSNYGGGNRKDVLEQFLRRQ